MREYFTYLVITRQIAPASCRVALHGVRFLFLTVLERAEFDVPLPKRPQRIPELLTRKEIARLLAATSHPKEQALLATGYGCGLRVTELVGLKVRHIDGECVLPDSHLPDVLDDLVPTTWMSQSLTLFR